MTNDGEFTLLEDPLCAYCLAVELVSGQELRSGVKQRDQIAETIPLFAAVEDPTAFVAEEAMIAALRQDIQRTKAFGLIPDEINPNDASGHTFRRSGAKHLAREGVPMADQIHGSSFEQCRRGLHRRSLGGSANFGLQVVVPFQPAGADFEPC